VQETDSWGPQITFSSSALQLHILLKITKKNLTFLQVCLTHLCFDVRVTQSDICQYLKGQRVELHRPHVWQDCINIRFLQPWNPSTIILMLLIKCKGYKFEHMTVRNLLLSELKRETEKWENILYFIQPIV